MAGPSHTSLIYCHAGFVGYSQYQLVQLSLTNHIAVTSVKERNCNLLAYPISYVALDSEMFEPR